MVKPVIRASKPKPIMHPAAQNQLNAQKGLLQNNLGSPNMGDHMKKLLVACTGGAFANFLLTAPAQAYVNEGPPTFVAYLVAGFFLFLVLLPIPFAINLDKHRLAAQPSTKRFRWGYYWTISMIAAGTFVLLAGVGEFISDKPNSQNVATIRIFLGGFWIALGIPALLRNKYAFAALIALSLNPIIWLINSFYLARRWAEMTPAPETARVMDAPHANKKQPENSTVKFKTFRETASQHRKILSLAIAAWPVFFLIIAGSDPLHQIMQNLGIFSTIWVLSALCLFIIPLALTSRWEDKRVRLWTFWSVIWMAVSPFILFTFEPLSREIRNEYNETIVYLILSFGSPFILAGLINVYRKYIT